MTHFLLKWKNLKSKPRTKQNKRKKTKKQASHFRHPTHLMHSFEKTDRCLNSRNFKTDEQSRKIYTVPIPTSCFRCGWPELMVSALRSIFNNKIKPSTHLVYNFIIASFRFLTNFSPAVYTNARISKMSQS